MEKRSFIRRFLRKALIILASFILLVMVTAWYLAHRWDNQIRVQLKSYVLDMSDSLYNLQYDKLHLNLITGSLSIEKVSLVRDTAVYTRLQQAHKAPRFLYTFSADEINLKYFKVWRYFHKKQLSASSLVLRNPNIILELNTQNIDTTKPRNAYQNISKKISSIHLGTLLLDNTNLKYTYIKKDSSLIYTQLHELSVQVRDFLIDSVALQDPTRYLYARNYILDLKNYRYRTPDSLYWLHVRDVHYSAEDRSIKIGQFQVEPRYNREEFDRKSIYQRDRFDVHLNNIDITNLEPRLLLENQVFQAGKVVISSGDLDIYHNRNLPMSPGNKLGKFPNQLLLKVALPINIDTIIGKKTDILYTEINPKSQEAGKLSFQQVHGIFRNITNIDTAIARKSMLTAELDAVLMKSGKLKAHFGFSLKNNNGGFSVTGQLKDMDGRELNPVIKPLAMVEVKSCKINDLSFSMNGNERGARGEVKFLYSDLRVNILEKKEGSHEFKKKGLMSFIANLMVIRNENPGKEKTIIAHPAYTRDPNKSFFNLVWKTLFTGIKETALGENSPI
ncbi:hypothetical protein [Chitinophaga sp.]|uniref:hypothetical protein n=1 Tax=Chitinophaga sp. TaxID=1869181 RepID=UPI0031D77132